MFNKILVALDDSIHHRTVFAAAFALAQQTNAHLMLLHVLSTNEPIELTLPVFSGYYPTLSEDLVRQCHEEQRAIEERGLQRLQSLADEATAAGVPVEFTQKMGVPGPLICTIAKDWGADLIMVGRRGQSGLSELLLGSVSNHVLHHAPCAVLVIQPQVKETEET
ncbi:universal stress protein [Leptolyngbya ohadii]|uniref:universal stress protein n=1 Tax=Leptolyngbya ohadii TaxID=1962290 RepID=UPI000B59DC4C|nr:universal stress protein [Leptolyngbya ohadii]